MNKLEISFLESANDFNLRPEVWGSIQKAEREPETTPTRNRSAVTDEELELIESLRQGEDIAFATLVERYHGRLLRFAQSFVSSQAVAEEVVQETWMAILKGIHRFEGRSSLKTWIFRILQNRAKTKGTREHRYVSFSDVRSSTDQEENSGIELGRIDTTSHESSHQCISPTTRDEYTPERLLVSKQSLAQIEQAIQSLPPTQRQVIVLRDIEGIDSEEICQILNITATNQRVLLHRGRSKVRQSLHPYLQGHSSKSAAHSVAPSFVSNEKLAHRI